MCIRDSCEGASIKHVFVAVHCPFSNGLNKRTGQTLVNRIRCACNDPSSPKRSWTYFASRCATEYNSTPHSVTGYSPAYLLNGNSSEIVPQEFVNVSNIEADREVAVCNSMKCHNYNKKRYDKVKVDKIFHCGDRVYIDNGNKLNRSKLDPVCIGPFVISKCLYNHIYEIDLGISSKFSHRLYHISKLLPL